MDDDRELLERIRGGDGESFGVLYDRTRAWLRDCVVVPRVGRDGAEDVLAETYRTALLKLPSFDWRGVGLLHWLAAIARRKCQERRRLDADPRETPLPELFDVPDDAPTAEAEMIRAETLRLLRGRVEETLASLHPRYGEALRLRLLEGLGREACAERLNVTTATFDVVLHRAAKAFARRWSGA